MIRGFKRMLGVGILGMLSLLPFVSKAETNDGPEQPQQQGVSDLAWQARITHPGVDFMIRIHYPQGLHPQVDSLIGKAAREEFSGTLNEYMKPGYEVGEEAREKISADAPRGQKIDADTYLTPAGSYFHTRTYEVFRPSADIASIWYTLSEYTGGAHGNLTFDAVTYNIREGREVKLADIFTDEAKAKKDLLPLVVQGVRNQKSPDGMQMEYDADAMDLNINRMLLTPEGMKVLYAPYEMGSYVEGPFVIDIPKEQLMRLGARQGLWTVQP